MRSAGVELIEDIDTMAVMGFVEVVPKLWGSWQLKRRICDLMDERRPDLVVLIDYPGLNMRLARAAKERGLAVLYYVPPKVWAWRTSRAKALAEITERVAVVLPFEVDLLRGWGVEATYVGHPLLERSDDVPDRESFCKQWGLDPSRRLLAILPGSRAQEVRRHIEPFGRIADLVARARRDVLPVFSRAASIHAAAFHRTGFPFVDDARALLRHADAALIKSGTATLEAAIEGTPHVVAYITNPITMAIGKHLLVADHIALPNLVAESRLVPELLQEQVQPHTAGHLLLDLLDHTSEIRSQQVVGFERVRDRLGTPGAAGRVAAMAEELIERGRA